MSKKLIVLAILFLGLFGRGVVPPNSNDEINLGRAVESVSPGHFPLNQGNYGSCVAFGHAAACDILMAEDKLAGTTGKWLKSSPDSIYGGARNEARDRVSKSRSQGSNGFDAVKWLTDRGGVLYQQAYPQYNLDLSKYSIERTADWGYWGNGGRDDGLGGPLDKEAQKHPIKDAALVKTLAELDAALAAGYPVTICSGQGFTKTRDKDGFCRASGSWWHCMCIIGKRNGGRKGYLILNSWGNYCDGPKYQDQPDGSFYAEPAVVARILAQGDSWALSGQTGFPKKILPDWVFGDASRIPDDFIPSTDNSEEDSRDAAVFLGADGFYHFKENGKDYRYIQGSWYECNSTGCRKLMR